MIGKEVDALGNWVELKDGDEATVGYRLEESFAQVNVDILDPTGTVIRTLPQGAKGKGNHLIKWDGRDNSGATLPDGRYTVRVTVGDYQEVDAASPIVHGVITGLSFEGGDPSLLMGNETIPLASVIQVRGITED
jgi:flagellar basal-body rod modification protein FlgD